MLEGVALDKSLMQLDGLHPNEKGQPLVLKNIFPHLQPLLTQ
jgi:acyl-CoA thioesterase-1